MKGYLRPLALVGALAILMAACGQQEQGAPEGDEITRGGTLQLLQLADVDAAFDPQVEYYQVTWGYFRCCLLRTLVSFKGLDAGQGGNDLVPDLATDLPDVTDDGLTYTFTILDGVTYAPPFQDREIVAEDFINAMERLGNPNIQSGYPFYYSPIEGFDAFSEGEADSISGLRAVDDKTLEVTLSEPTGDFPFRMAMPATAPIPDGAEEGHEDDYGRFLVASGPYMFEGSEEMDFSLPPDQQTPAAGYEPGRSIVLVRNPSWSAEVDDIRPANVDRIEATIGGTTEDMFNKIDAGEADLHLDGVPPAQVIQAYQADPEKRARIFSHAADGTRYISLNLAVPPFDDIHVRKAVNYAIDKDGLRRLRGGPLFGELAGHIIVDGLLNDLLADYDPYATPNGQGDVEAAQAEMAQSEYDGDGDGVCDDPTCQDVLTIIDEADPYPDQTALIQDNLEPLGITLDVRSGERTGFMYTKCQDIGEGVPFCPSPGWGKDYSDASTYGEPLFGSVAVGPEGCCNYSNVGVPPDELQDTGLPAVEIPSVDDKIDECETTPIGDERFQCWAELDQMLMEDVVPWVPYLFDNDVFIIGEQLRNYQYDQFSGQPALDHIALAGGGGER